MSSVWVWRQNWRAGYSLHRRQADVQAFAQAYFDSSKSSPHQEMRGIPFTVQVSAAEAKEIGKYKYGMWGKGA